MENRLPKTFIERLRRKKELMKKGGLDFSELPATSRRRTHSESIEVLKLASARQLARKNANKASVARKKANTASVARQGEH